MAGIAASAANKEPLRPEPEFRSTPVPARGGEDEDLPGREGCRPAAAAISSTR